MQYAGSKHAFHIVPHSTDVGVQVRLVSGETFFIGEKTPLVVGATVNPI